MNKTVTPISLLSPIIMWPFTKKEVAPPPASIPWPNALNPCREEGHGRKSALYGVKGKVTELCVHCVVYHSNRVGINAALDSFVPDPDGKDTK